MQTVKYKVEYVDVSLLKVHPNNPRFILDDDFTKLCESIKSNPYYFEARPIICDKDYVIWAGNQRYRAGKHIGMKEVPTIILDMSEEVMREIMIRDNVSNGKWDTGLLSSLYDNSELEKWGVDMSQFGVEVDEMPDTLTSSNSDKKPTMKITFETAEKLNEAKADFDALCTKYGALLSVSAGEL